MKNQIDTKGIIWFLGFAFIPTITLSLILGSMQEAFGENIILYNKLFLVMVMFCPGISALIVRKFVNKECLKDPMMRFGSWKPYLQVTLFIPFLYILIFAITGLLYPPDFTLKSYMSQAGIEEIPLDPSSLISAIFIITLFIAPLANFIPAFGEEIGWRGFLLPKLLPFGQQKALIISGIIWGLWHLPFVFFLGYGNYENKIAGAIIFTVLITLLGVYIGALALKNKSTLLASYMHGIFNAQDHGIWIVTHTNYNHLIGGGEGLIGVIVLLPVALYYLKERGSK